jgi:hypothetical protein
MSRCVRLTAFALIALLLPCLLQGQEKQKKKKKDRSAKAITLFDGSSLDAWDFHLVDPDVTMADVWSIEDGVLVCKGEPLGYLHTKEDFKNYRLTLDWRWAPGKKPGNSGVLLRATGKPIGFMPKCVEAQLKSGSAGDIWAFRGFQLAETKDRWREIKANPNLGDFFGPAAMENRENEPGEWNTYQIMLKDDKLVVKVNGEVVNRVSGCDVVAGKIGLQSEGAEIHFRNVKITPLD